MQTATIQGELWGARAEDWTEICEPQTRPLWSAMQEAVAVGPATRYLDLGCGGGTAAKRAALRGAGVSGYDASEALLRIANRQVPEGDFRQGDLESLPFQDDSFDVITASNVLQFVEDKPRALREIRRVLAPGGKFAVGMWAEPEKCEMAAVFKAVSEAVPGPPNHEPTLAVRDNLIGLLETNGFKVVREQEVECVFDWSNFDECWRGIRSAGMMEAASRAVGDDVLRNAIQGAADQFKRPDGSIRMVNMFRYVVCDRGM
jgi:SAM-dependent methyltransferase